VGPHESLFSCLAVRRTSRPLSYSANVVVPLCDLGTRSQVTWVGVVVPAPDGFDCPASCHGIAGTGAWHLALEQPRGWATQGLAAFSRERSPAYRAGPCAPRVQPPVLPAYGPLRVSVFADVEWHRALLAAIHVGGEALFAGSALLRLSTALPTSEVITVSVRFRVVSPHLPLSAARPAVTRAMKAVVGEARA
jgi:hypothetical protein